MDDELQLTNALRRRGTTMLCPACQFALRGPIGAYRLLPDGDEEPSLGGREGIKVVVYGCANCGYVRLHSANVLQKLREQADEVAHVVEAHRLPRR
jgi:predicted RNA-binding Zn-ribbon protein involved in translation (DUF1610 family)